MKYGLIERFIKWWLNKHDDGMLVDEFAANQRYILDTIEELKAELEDWKTRPLYLAKNAAIRYSERTGLRYSDLLPIFETFCEILCAT